MTAAVVWAVVSTYRPGPSAVEAIASVRGQVDGVIVVDDGSGEDSTATLDRLRELGAHVTASDANVGIAANLNRGMRIAHARGASHVLTLDQDSVVPEGFVAGLREGAEKVVDEWLGAAVPEYFADVRQATAPPDADGLAPAANVIQSGMLIPLRTIQAVGDLREDFFIDLVDTEFELRLRRRGYRVVAVAGLRLGHALGTKYDRRLFGRPVRVPGIPPEVTLSTPFRYFYRVRNRLVLDREYFRSAPAQIVRDTLLDAVHFVNALALARPRRALARIYRAALFAAVRGRMGPMPAPLRTLAATVRWDAPLMSEGDR
ncbi:glycosyltransferase family 2 protein [Microbacterium sp. zg-Y818]|uniref:glycosyltransferase family 2 protein n=1 Tax=unclassified Microbacterium TaxID=2609290 RepID=UPI00214C4EC1|nr:MULTISPECIES: glycosyltransferase family 2 protein [unclassified Microbacterium]MCR2801713.1 glycosyltransferase family 2 protein [Microbacterium sp. zg.Y818]WIM23020.1 glycosyltransferase family 2 protein [Microbacterium sp. zg-Y818]